MELMRFLTVPHHDPRVFQLNIAAADFTDLFPPREQTCCSCNVIVQDKQAIWVFLLYMQGRLIGDSR